MKKVDARKQTRTALLKRRKQVIRLHQQGVPVMRIVEESGLSWSAVNAAIKLYEANGDEALMPAARGRKQGTNRVLNKEQETEIHRIISVKRPWQCKFKSRHLWDKSLVMQLIEINYSINLSMRGLDKYLNRWGFALKDQKKRPYERCSDNIKEWLDNNYSAIEHDAQKNKANIYWLNRTILKYPNESELKKKRQKLLMFTVVTNSGKLRCPRWLVIKGAFNTKKQISFLKALIMSARNNVFLISEISKINFSDDAMNWIKKKCKDEIKVFSEDSYPPKENEKKQLNVSKADQEEIDLEEGAWESENLFDM